MKKESRESILLSCDNTFEIIFSLETILKLTQETCLEKEVKSIYYSLSDDKKFTLSEERNQYICMLNLALEKLKELKKISIEFEDNLFVYNSTPTIAADR